MSEPSEYRLAFERLGEILCSLERAPTATDIRRLRAVIDRYGAAARAEGDQAGYERGKGEHDEVCAHLAEYEAMLRSCRENCKKIRREAIEACARLIEQQTVVREHKGMSVVDNLNFLLETTAAEVRALAEPTTQPASQPQEQSA